MHRCCYAVILSIVMPLVGCSTPDASSVSDTPVETPFTAIIKQNLRPDPDHAKNYATSDAFDRHISYLGYLAFSDSVLLGSPSRFMAGDDGRFLLLDARGREVHVFEATGNHVATLDGRGCDPGLTWSPHNATILSDGRFIVLNVSTGGLVLFDADGSCARVLETGEFGVDGLAPTDDGAYILFKSDGDTWTVTEHEPVNGASTTLHTDSSFAHLLYRFKTLSYTVNGPDNSVLVNIPFIGSPLVIERDGSDPYPLMEKPSFFRQADNDVPDTRGMDIDEIMDLFDSRSKMYSLTQQIFRFSSNTTLLYYGNSYVDGTDVQSHALLVVDDEGHLVTPEPIFFSRGDESNYSGFSPRFAKDHLLFSYRPSQPDSTGEWMNPGLDVWQFH